MENLIGKKIKMIQMDDPDPILEGTVGRITGIDFLGTLYVEWENGRSLSVIPGEDSYEILEESESTG
jgi:Domain of unknown function (DUF4314)